MEGALKGVRVIDLSHILAGPTATMILADLGAEVIHIEPPEGDGSRDYGPFVGSVDKDHSAYFASINRNKKSVVLNLKHEDGKRVLKELIKIADVVIENYRPGTMSRMGLDWPALQRINPGIIYASISGFGHESLSEYAGRPVYDIVAQAYSGLMSITGMEQGTPVRVGSSMGDILAGHHAAIGILAALYNRTLTGRGQWYDGSMIDSLFFTLENAVVRYTAKGDVAHPLGTAHPTIAPFQAFPTRDNWIVIAIGSDKLWIELCRVLGREDLVSDARFQTNQLRSENRVALIPILTEVLAAKTTGEWVDFFNQHEIPCSRVNNMQQICEDPHIKARKMLVEIDQPQMGRMKIAGSPFHLSETPGGVYRPAPVLGEHTEEVLVSLLKMPPDEIQRLRKEGVIN